MFCTRRLHVVVACHMVDNYELCDLVMPGCKTSHLCDLSSTERVAGHRMRLVSGFGPASQGLFGSGWGSQLSARGYQ